MEENQFLVRLKAIAILLWSFFSVYFLFTAPQELAKVREVRDYIPVQVFLEKIESRILAGTNIKLIGAIRFYEPRKNILVRINDLRPGDIENNAFAAVLSGEGNLSNKYREKTQIIVYQSPNGREFFLERGTYIPMTLALIASFGFWIIALAKIILAYKRK